MQITNISLSKTHVSRGDVIDVTITVAMGADESLPNIPAQTPMIQLGTALENAYQYQSSENFPGYIALVATVLEGQGDQYPRIRNPNIAAGTTKTFTFPGCKVLPIGDEGHGTPSDGGAARAYSFAVYATGFKWVSYPDATRYAAAPIDSVGTFLLSRLNPVINNVAISDTHDLNPRGHFGAFVQGKSLPRFAGNVTLDPLDPTLTAVHTLTLKAGSTTIYTASNTTGVFSPGAISAVGTISWTYAVTDSTGRSASTSGSFTVLPYAAPVISTLRAERYKVVLDDVGSPTYPAAYDGELVRFTVSADVAAVASKNAWSLAIKYGPAGGGTTTVTPLTGANGGATTIRRIDDRTLVTAAIPAGDDYDFEFALSDFFGSVKMIVTAYKAGASQHFSKRRGEGFGMRCTGTPENPCADFAHPINAHAGIYDGHGRRIGATDYSSGSVDAATLTGNPIVVDNTSGDLRAMVVRAPGAGAAVTVRRAGKNLWSTAAMTSPETRNGVTMTRNADGSISLSGTATAAISKTLFGSYGGTTSYLELPPGTYTVPTTTSEQDGYQMALYRVGETTSVLDSLAASRRTVTLAAHTQIGFALLYIPSGSNVTGKIARPQLELGAIATGFETHSSADYTVPLGGSVEIPALGGINVLMSSAALWATTYRRVATGERWIDGRAVYRRMLPFGAIAANGTLTIPTGEAAIAEIVDMRGVFTPSDTTVRGPIPYASYSAASSQMQLAIYNLPASPYVQLRTGSGHSAKSGHIIADYTLPSRNLAYNGGFLLGGDGWAFDVDVSIDPIRRLGGSPSVQVHLSGLSQDVWRGVRSAAAYRAPCSPGEMFSGSIYAYVEDYTTFAGRSIGLDILYYNAAGSQRAQQGYVKLVPAAQHNNNWTRLVIEDAPAAPADAAWVGLFAFVTRNGTCWFARPQLERGSAVTDWVP